MGNERLTSKVTSSHVWSRYRRYRAKIVTQSGARIIGRDRQFTISDAPKTKKCHEHQLQPFLKIRSHPARGTSEIEEKEYNGETRRGNEKKMERERKKETQRGEN